LNPKTNSAVRSEALKTLRHLLEEFPAGVSEFELIQGLRQKKTVDFIDNRFDDNLTLFQSHFLLFHHLYHLQSLLWSSQEGNLSISPLSIKLSEYQEGESHLQQRDPLRNYYIDTDNLENTTREEIDTLLANFWEHYLNPTRQDAALDLLGLEDPVNDTEIKHRYRKLVMEHHPDRGGDTVRLQSLNEAIGILFGKA